METLSYNDILSLNRAIGDIYTARDMDAFYSTVFSSLREIISHELCSFNNIGLSPTRFLNVISRSQDHIDVINKHHSALNAYIHEHPLYSHVSSDHVFKTTDVAPKNKFKATAIYNEFYRHLDTETQIGLSMPISQQTVSFLALSRNTTDFSERDRLILALLKPHCINALRNVTDLGRVTLERDLLQKGAEAERQGAVLFQPNGMIVCISSFAREMFGRYFNVDLAEGDTLPERLLRWVEFEGNPSHPIAKGGKFPQRVEHRPLVVEKEGKSLVIKLLNDVTTGDCILFITETDPLLLLQNLRNYSLSSRETQVLFWLSQGKTNVEIAAILGMSKRTAEKHLEHIFAKLGVETRAAAIAVMTKAVLP